MPTAASTTFSLTAAQRNFFELFGFLRLPGLFAPEISRLNAGFESVFAEHPTWDTNVSLHFDERRSIIPSFISKSPDLAWLLDDPRVVGIMTDLIGAHYEYAESDGNLFFCETSWHADTYAAPLEQYHVKMSFYLDELDADSGAIRLIPGSNHVGTRFADSVRNDLADPDRIHEIYGVDPRDIPFWSLPNVPGDLVMWNFRTVHSSFLGDRRRRLFSVNFREPLAVPG